MEIAHSVMWYETRWRSSVESWRRLHGPRSRSRTGPGYWWAAHAVERGEGARREVGREHAGWHWHVSGIVDYAWGRDHRPLGRHLTASRHGERVHVVVQARRRWSLEDLRGLWAVIAIWVMELLVEESRRAW